MKFLSYFTIYKSNDSHFITQELSKLNLKIKVIPNGLEKYMSFTINNKLTFIDTSNFLVLKYF